MFDNFDAKEDHFQLRTLGSAQSHVCPAGGTSHARAYTSYSTRKVVYAANTV
jgi:hypothetical protein